jgi:hypothetical protein
VVVFVDLLHEGKSNRIGEKGYKSLTFPDIVLAA